MDGGVGAVTLPAWTTRPFWTVASRVDVNGRGEEQLLSVYRDWGVVRKADRDDNFNQAGEDLMAYKFVEPGDLVLNKMKTWQGSLGVSEYQGIVSPAYFVCKLSPNVHGRFVHHLLRSHRYIGHYKAYSKGIRPNQWDLPYESLRQLPLFLPGVDEQRRIADFLDERVGWIDRIISARRQQANALELSRRASLVQAIFRPKDRLIPCSGVLDIRLGRQRSPQHETGEHMLPYLRSANVSDGRLLLQDVKEMNFTPDEQKVFRLLPGDVLVSEGSASADAVGAAAVWKGEIAGTVCFQNTLLRLRSRPGGDSAFLGLWARACHAAGAPKSFASGASILHLGAQGMARMQMPKIETSEQVARANSAKSALDAHRAIVEGVQHSIELLVEYKTSLITAAVTGELDVTTASRRIPGD